MLNRIAETHQQIERGALSWNSIILTGGGSALLYQRLLPILDHDRVIPADELESMHLAIIRGGFKLWRLYEVHRANPENNSQA